MKDRMFNKTNIQQGDENLSILNLSFLFYQSILNLSFLFYLSILTLSFLFFIFCILSIYFKFIFLFKLIYFIIISFPKKKFNPTHAQPHIAIVTSPKNVNFIKEPPVKNASHNNIVSVKHKLKEQKDKNIAVKLKINLKNIFSTDPN